jgi:Fe2+ or Zn2+ uptake regulation protein
VEDVDLCLIDVLEREVSKRIKGTLLSHTIELGGLCQRCTERVRGDKKAIGCFPDSHLR